MNDNIADFITQFFGQAAEMILNMLTGYSDEQAFQMMEEANAMAKARAAYQAERARQREGRKADQEKSSAVITRCKAHYTTNLKAAHRPRDMIQNG